MFKLRFPIDGGTDIAESFKVNEPERIVSRGKPFVEMLLVLVHALFKVAGDANVQHSTRGALHHVDVVAAIRVQGASSLAQTKENKRWLDSARHDSCPIREATDILFTPYVCKIPTLNFGTSGLCDAASSAWMMASRVSIGSMILSIHSRAAP